MADERADLVKFWNEYHPNAKIAAVAAPVAPKPTASKPAPRPAHSFLIDVSSFNNPNLAILKPHGVVGVSSQVTDGRGFADGNFKANWEASRRDGVAFSAYHFMRSTSSVDEQLANIRAHIVDPRIPVHLDCEPANTSRPNLWHVRQFISLAPKHGIKLGLLYLPHWYWMQLGSPSLRGLLPLWQSSYGANPVGSPSYVYSRIGGDHAAAGWTPQGGVTPTVFQFGSQVRVPGYAGNLDADAYRGPVSDLIKRGLYI